MIKRCLSEEFSSVCAEYLVIIYNGDFARWGRR